MKIKILATITTFFWLMPSTHAANTKQEQNMSIQYPATKTVNIVDQYFGQPVKDPYRWLEDDRSQETADWIQKQNTLTSEYLKRIPYRDVIEQRLTALMDYEKVGRPFTEGEYTYFFKNDGLQNQDVLYRQKGKGKPEVFLDPNVFSQDGTTSLDDVSFSDDGSMLAYSISEDGSDWRKIIIINSDSKTQIGHELVDIKFSNISWLKNEGFFYSSYEKPQGSELSAKTDQHKLYFHHIGQNQGQDTLVFGDNESEKFRYVSGKTSRDGRYLFISASNSTSGNELFIKDLSIPNAPLTPIIVNTKSDTWVVDTNGSTLYLATNLDAPNQRVVKADAKQPQPENWQDVIAENEHVLDVTAAGGFLFAHYMVDATSLVKQFNRDGKWIRDIALPDIGSAEGFAAKLKDSTLYYTFTNYKTPDTTFELDIQSGKSTPFYTSSADFNPQNYESKQVFYKSKDGTQVPMIITYKKGTKLDGNNPTLLYGYGGFNISLTPNFHPTRAAWMELGGVYAVPNLRGGGEYGKEWHDAGTQMQKQNVFDDFIAAAEYLINKGYTSPGKLAISGGSNGGLLVGAAMTQRPELFKVALPAVGVLDMLRYHTFTAGAGWAYDYGTAEQSQPMFEYLKNYSPVHNVNVGTHYPATLVTTGDHDDRVVPAHSYKFTAQLQAKQTGKQPTLIRIETDSGHGAGTPTHKIINYYTDTYSFTLYNMGIDKL